MPSIAKSKLDELTATARAAEERADRERTKRDEAEWKIRAFDGILDKILLAADGMPLVESRGGGYANLSYSTGYNDQSRWTDAERREAEVERLRDRVVNLERQIAAVKAVTQFAKIHKG